MKFLFDLFPLLLFFLAFKLWGIFAATAVTIAATLAQIVWMAVRRRRVEPMLWVNLGIVAVFGSATLLLHNEIFIKWKPTALYGLFAAALAVAQFGFGKNLIQAALDKQIALPSRIWSRLNMAWMAFFAALGLLNLVVAYHFSTAAWAHFKLFGATACLVIFIIAQSLWLIKYLPRK
ncbi:intracellular septation protein [Candidatus Glomeribacter gigasporarum BEG34]|uniref:Inner membrane-spanning protein YciB n=1 Tax=Candidatus Glomeribacter gigasporarum BEG34 TaxID=1070319 RepID=G2J9V7_9BURK|nr:septation protein A [Candidatus Glomeribacter gigasporarum]CCD29554.1 intracellular septation protein [Candidatus Glomeribacter gigasporarum BEG34]